MIDNINNYEIVDDTKFSRSGKSLRFNLNNDKKTCITLTIDNKKDLDLNFKDLVSKYKKVFEMELEDFYKK